MMCYNNIVASGDAHGYVKIWVAGNSLTPLVTTTVAASKTPVAYLRLVFRRGKIELFAATNSIFEVDVFSGERTNCIPAPHQTPLTSITAENEFVFSTAQFPSTMVAVWKERPGRGAGYDKWGLMGNDSMAIHYLEPLKDGRHVCVMSGGGYVGVWDYQLLREKHRVQTVMGRAVTSVRHSRSDAGKFWVTYDGWNMEQAFALGSEKEVDRRDLTITSKKYPKSVVRGGIVGVIDDRILRYASFAGESPKTYSYRIPSAVTLAGLACGGQSCIGFGSIGNTPLMMSFQLDTTQQSVNPTIPTVMMSMGAWLDSKAALGIKKTAPPYTRHVVTMARNPSNSKEYVYLTSRQSNDLAVFSNDLALLHQQNFAFAEVRVKTGISAIALTPDCKTVLVGTTRGKLLRMELGAAPQPTEVDEADQNRKEGRSKLEDKETGSNMEDQHHDDDEKQLEHNNLFQSFRWEVNGFRLAVKKIIGDSLEAVPKGIQLRQQYDNLSRESQVLFAEFKSLLETLPVVDIPQEALAELQAVTDAVVTPIRPTGAQRQRLVKNQTDFEKLFCCTDNWYRVPKSLRLFKGQPTCPGCGEMLTGYYTIYQLCAKCAERRAGPDRCVQCAVTKVKPGVVLCASCTVRQKAEIQLCILQVVIVGNVALCGGVDQRLEECRGEDGGAVLTTIGIDWMNVQSREKRGYRPGYHTLAGTEAAGGLFAAVRNPHLVTIYASEVRPNVCLLHKAVLGSFQIAECSVLSVSFYSRHTVGSLSQLYLIITGAGGTVAMIAIQFDDSTHDLITDTHAMLKGRCNSCTSTPIVPTANDKLVAVGSASGTIAVIGTEYEPDGSIEMQLLMKLQGHMRSLVSELYFDAFHLISAANDGTIMHYPLELFSHDDKRNATLQEDHVLILEATPNDSFYCGSDGPLLLLDSSWKWRPDSTRAWRDIDSDTAGLLLHMGTQATADVQWTKPCLSGTLSKSAFKGTSRRQAAHEGIHTSSMVATLNDGKDHRVVVGKAIKGVRRSVHTDSDTHLATTDTAHPLSIEFPGFLSHAKTWECDALLLELDIFAQSPAVTVRVRCGDDVLLDNARFGKRQKMFSLSTQQLNTLTSDTLTIDTHIPSETEVNVVKTATPAALALRNRAMESFITVYAPAEDIPTVAGFRVPRIYFCSNGSRISEKELSPPTGES